ncbi:uncharacterized protein LOC110698221 [Chenopodium quinoa]|uniref:uncharacterized protein LOC110698221 n=1 Tax=Chenopodium quinoa TaxID=63459 RepID=UPI000B782DBE|nr:uncharacterized protein LOC110698221 [Chenopodium quinoa]
MFVYGSPDLSGRSSVWAEFTHLLQTYHKVLLIGDFNQVEYNTDKVGGSAKITGQTQFQEWKIDSGLLHIPFTRPTFTLTNAIILQDKPEFTPHRPYRIENWCLLSKEVANIISLSWSLEVSGSPMYTISRKLEILRSKLLKCWVVHDHDGVRKIILDYFSHLFCSPYEHINLLDFDWATMNLPHLSPSGKVDLMIPISAAEIKQVMFNINDSKTPGLEGFTSAFFKSHWTTVGPSVISTVQYFFLHGHMLRERNRTFIVLLPKVDHPQQPSQFRPIGLCNVLYKCIAKCIAFRLRKVLPSLVSDSQNAFVPGRLMSDNSLTDHEFFSYMNRSRGRTMSTALKLDMNKAYDRVNWKFLWQPSPTACNEVLQLKVQASLGSYLGLPVDIGRSKRKAFQPLIDTIVNRLSGFASLHLFAAAKLVIISSVLVTSLNHVLSVFKIPSSVTDAINNLLIRFWWKTNPHSKGLAMAPSSLLFRPKGFGGLGL